MRISTLGRHMREGLRNVVRNGWMSFASASAISISLFILGVFLLLSLNVSHITRQVEGEVQIRVILEVDVAQEQIENLEQSIGALPEVKSVTFISKEEGLQLLREQVGPDGQNILEGLEEENPLPDSFAVEVHQLDQIAAAANAIMALNETSFPKPIEEVDYGRDTVEKLAKITAVVRNVSLVLVAGLAFTAMFLIANTIKLTILARRKEIAIMKLVGATNGFIRWPFFIEGALLGLVGSVIPAIILMYGYIELVRNTQVNLGLMMLQLIPVADVILKIPGFLIVLGVGIGVWGSTLSIRKFLKV